MNALPIIDTALTGGDLQLAPVLGQRDWLAVVVYTSLYTDAWLSDADLQADTDQDAVTDRRGCWADTFHTRSRGSLLWTLRRRKLTPQTLLRARDICLAALLWLVRDGHVRSVDVTVTRETAIRMSIFVRLGVSRGDPREFKSSFEVSVNGV